MKIQEITNNKKKYMDLLLIGDEQESMINKYIEKGRMFVYFDNIPKAVCIVEEKENKTIEIKNIAVYPQFQKKGIGKKIIDFVCQKYNDNFDTLEAGTGDSPMTVPFYEKCGFKRNRIIKDFFIDNYDHEIFEYGIQLKDMIIFQKKLKNSE